MADGFTTPSPADDDGDRREGEPLTEKYEAIPDDPDLEDKLSVVETEASCENCSHSAVCSIYGDFSSRIAQSFGPDTPGSDEAPVDAERLAWHCEMYDPEDDGETPEATQ